MTRRLLFFLLIFFILFATINSKSECSCTCCKGNGCIKKYQGSIQMLTCSATSCKNTCKIRYPGQCGRSPGYSLATCTKTKKTHRASPVKKTKHKLTQSSKKTIYHRMH